MAKFKTRTQAKEELARGFQEVEFLKTCSKCKKEKSSLLFNNDKQRPDGKTSQCKECRQKKKNEWYVKNAEIQRQKTKEWKKRNEEYVSAYRKDYQERNKMKLREKSRQWRIDNLEYARFYDKWYNETNKDKKREYRQEAKVRRKKEIKERRSNWRKKQLEGENGDVWRAKERARSVVYGAWNRSKFRKDSPCVDILGCDYDEFKLHIESQFKDGMTWENKNEWDIDHIYPISWCDTKEEVYIYSHYSNLHPMWSSENAKKYSNWIGKEEPKP